MKNLFLVLVLLSAVSQQISAQRTINFSGKINNFDSSELVYLRLKDSTIPLEINTDGTFSVEQNIDQKTFFFSLSKISKNGKLEPQTPLIWSDKDSVFLELDWINKSYQFKDSMPFQTTSEKLEGVNDNQQIKLILNNPNTLPSLYFASKNKENISLSDLEKIMKSIDQEYKNTIYVKRIESYLLAKKKTPLRKGDRIENFKLPNKDGELISVVTDRNKPQVIALFSSGCSYSIASIDLLKQLSELNTNKIEIVTIWDDETKETWRNSHQDQKSKISWTNLWDEFGYAATYLDRKLWPTFYIINENGELTQILEGYDKKTARGLKKLVE
ncbi:TlpA family protein disulfide reductase [Mangrovivirga cuniculi]|uniref:Thioredoxin domain-containing protein n=1 Tax=Mangrovivirga cuniculi TaxID=2715131 RepID=A0A4D7JJ65_9BACT|nr:thioredoxin-like domain-containing protein [Mangrovivirga cuniculi]QCK15631.1 hypothetical protein DCC35_13200 [Mangrovivirga cuniculi]